MEERNPEWVSTSLNMTKELATSCFCKDLQCKMAAGGSTWPAMPQGAQGNLTVCSQLTWHMVKTFVAESTDTLSDHVNLRPVPPTAKYFRRLWFLFQNLSASVDYTKVLTEKPLQRMKELILHIRGTPNEGGNPRAPDTKPMFICRTLTQQYVRHRARYIPDLQWSLICSKYRSACGLDEAKVQNQLFLSEVLGDWAETTDIFQQEPPSHHLRTVSQNISFQFQKQKVKGNAKASDFAVNPSFFIILLWCSNEFPHSEIPLSGQVCC